MEGGDSRVCRKRKEFEGGENEGGRNLTNIPSMYDQLEDVDLDVAQLYIEEGMVAEVMKRLEEEINHPCGGTDAGEVVPCSQYDHQLQMVPSFSSSSAVDSAASFVTINGNEESCGPSFSDSSSTVMASIDTRGVIGLSYFADGCVATGAPLSQQPSTAAVETEIWPWFVEPAVEEASWAPFAEPAVGEFAVEDMEESDDEWLARFLSGSGFELEG